MTWNCQLTGPRQSRFSPFLFPRHRQITPVADRLMDNVNFRSDGLPKRGIAKNQFQYDASGSETPKSNLTDLRLCRKCEEKVEVQVEKL
jgi:hypothetical protein